MKGYKKINFQQLIENDYHPHTLYAKLQILNWIYKWAEPYNPPKKGWYKDGIDKLLFGYSANDRFSQTGIYDVSKFCHFALFRVLVKTPDEWFKKWKEDFGIALNKSKFFKLDQDYGNRDCYMGKADVRYLIHSLQKYKGMNLKKEYCHPDYVDRTHAYMTDIRFTMGSRFQVIYGFNFAVDETFKGCSWKKSFVQQDDETLRDFLLRVHAKCLEMLDTPTLPVKNIRTITEYRNDAFDMLFDKLMNGEIDSFHVGEYVLEKAKILNKGGFDICHGINSIHDKSFNEKHDSNFKENMKKYLGERLLR